MTRVDAIPEPYLSLTTASCTLVRHEPPRCHQHRECNAWRVLHLPEARHASLVPSQFIRDLTAIAHLTTHTHTRRSPQERDVAAAHANALHSCSFMPD